MAGVPGLTEMCSRKGCPEEAPEVPHQGQARATGQWLLSFFEADLGVTHTVLCSALDPPEEELETEPVRLLCEVSVFQRTLHRPGPTLLPSWSCQMEM